MNDAQVKIIIETLKQKQVLTGVEKDILDTYNELSKVPFQRSTAENKIKENNLKYPDIFATISILPTTTVKPFNQVDDTDIRYNLIQQLIAMCLKRQQE